MAKQQPQPRLAAAIVAVSDPHSMAFQAFSLLPWLILAATYAWELPARAAFGWFVLFIGLKAVIAVRRRRMLDVEPEISNRTLVLGLWLIAGCAAMVTVAARAGMFAGLPPGVLGASNFAVRQYRNLQEHHNTLAVSLSGGTLVQAGVALVAPLVIYASRARAYAPTQRRGIPPTLRTSVICCWWIGLGSLFAASYVVNFLMASSIPPANWRDFTVSLDANSAALMFWGLLFAVQAGLTMGLDAGFEYARRNF